MGSMSICFRCEFFLRFLYASVLLLLTSDMGGRMRAVILTEVCLNCFAWTTSQRRVGVTHCTTLLTADLKRVVWAPASGGRRAARLPSRLAPVKGNKCPLVTSRSTVASLLETGLHNWLVLLLSSFSRLHLGSCHHNEAMPWWVQNPFPLTPGFGSNLF